MQPAKKRRRSRRRAGIPMRTLYRLLRDRAVPCLPMGEPQDQDCTKVPLADPGGVHFYRNRVSNAFGKKPLFHRLEHFYCNPR